MKRFGGKRVLITGGASGIGRATAGLFAREGARLVIGDIDASGAQKLADDLISQYNANIDVVSFDAASPESCRELVETALTRMDGLDILLNIAGIMGWGEFESYPDEAWQRMLDINLSSVFYLMKAASGALKASGGNIVNVASAGALTAVPFTVAYTVAKAGVVALTKSAVVELSPHGVRINAVAPGGVDTPMHAKTMSSNPLDPELMDKVVARHTPKLKGALACQPEEVAAAIAYLASDDARFATGTVLVLDGGQLTG